MGKKMKCGCGTIFAIDDRPANGIVYCPGCGIQRNLSTHAFNQPTGKVESAGFPQPMMHDPNPPYGAAYPTQPPYQEYQSDNTYSVLGFILAILSFFTCFFLAPIALFICIKGLKERDGKGFAIAGLLISAFETLVLISFVAYFVIMAIVLGSIGAAAMSFISTEAGLAIQKAETFKVMVEAREEIQSFHNKEKRWPNEAESSKILSKYRDSWDRPLRFQKHSPNRVSLDSAGADGKFGNRDDIQDQWTAFSINRPLNASPSPSARHRGVHDITSALEHVSSGSFIDRRTGLSWLSSSKVDSSQQAKVLEKVRPLLLDHFVVSEAVNAYKKWGKPDDIPSLVSTIDKRGSTARGFVNWGSLFELLRHFKATDSVLVFINHPNERLRSTARQWAKRNGIQDKALAERCISDLADKKRKSNAMDYLATFDVVPEIHEQVIRAITPHLKNDRHSQKDSALNVVDKWGPTKSILDKLIEIKATKQIVKIKDRRTLAYLGKLLEDWPIRSREGAKYLKQIGPAGEQYVWPVIRNKNHIIARSALRVLSDIGTKQSLPELRKLQEDRMIGYEVKRVIRAIESANRKPESWD